MTALLNSTTAFFAAKIYITNIVPTAIEALVKMCRVVSQDIRKGAYPGVKISFLKEAGAKFSQLLKVLYQSFFRLHLTEPSTNNSHLPGVFQ